jgi:hypothetical protein
VCKLEHMLRRSTDFQPEVKQGPRYSSCPLEHSKRFHFGACESLKNCCALQIYFLMFLTISLLPFQSSILSMLSAFLLGVHDVYHLTARGRLLRPPRGARHSGCSQGVRLSQLAVCGSTDAGHVVGILCHCKKKQAQCLQLPSSF